MNSLKSKKVRTVFDFFTKKDNSDGLTKDIKSTYCLFQSIFLSLLIFTKDNTL